MTENSNPTPVAPVSPAATGKCGELEMATDLPVNYDYHAAMKVLAKCLCKDCGGTGERNDADVGDISFNSWECSACDGKGWDRQAYFENFPVPSTRSQAEELLAAEIRRERDLAAKQLSEVVDRMSDDYLALKAELDQAVGVIEDRSSEYEALEAKLAAAEKALEPFADIADLVDAETEGMTETDELVLHFHDYEFAKWPVALFRQARAVLGGKP